MRTGPVVRRMRLIAGRSMALVLVAALGGAVGGCTGDHGSTPRDKAAAPAASHTAAAHTPAAHAAAIAEAEAAAKASETWAARPAFVQTANAATQEAYLFTLARPDVIEWLPCYCGCVAMDHRSNLDCFYKPSRKGDLLAFEEHGSVCNVCVDTALMAKNMLKQNRSLIEIRASVDAAFGNLAPGTPTKLPPVG